MTDSIHEYIKAESEQIVSSIMQHMNDDNREEIFGTALYPIYGGGTGKTLVSMCLLADALRIITDAIFADSELSDQEAELVYPFLADVAKLLPRFRKEYSVFKKLQIKAVADFLEFYQKDKKHFGYSFEKTKWSGMDICCNLAGHYGLGEPLQKYVAFARSLTQMILEADGMTDEEEEYLSSLQGVIRSRCEETGIDIEVLADLGLLAAATEEDPEDDGREDVDPDTDATSKNNGIPDQNNSGGFSLLKIPEDHWEKRLAFHPTKHCLAVGGEGTVTLWDLSSRSAANLIRGKRDASVESLIFSSDGNQIAVCFYEDYKARVFDIESGQRTSVLDGEENEFQVFGVLPTDGSIVASNGWLGTIDRWDMSNSEKLSSITAYAGSTEKVHSLALTPDSRFAVTSREDDEDLRIYSLESNKRVGGCWGHTATVGALAGSPRSNTVASGDENGTIIIWEIPSGEIVGRIESELRDVSALQFSPCGAKLCVSGWSERSDETACIVIIDTHDLSISQRINLDGRPTDLAISFDGTFLAHDGCTEGGVIVWRMGTSYDKSEIIEVLSVQSTVSSDMEESDEEIDADDKAGEENAIEEEEVWDEDNDPIGGEEEIDGVFDPEGWTLPTSGNIEWAALLEVAGSAQEAALVGSKEWQVAQAENRVLTIQHTGNGMSYVGRVGLRRGLNLCRVVVGCSLPSDIRVVNVDVHEISCDYSDAQEEVEQISDQLIAACQEGDPTAAKLAIDSGANLTHQDYMNDNDLTPLRAAIENGHLEMVQLLIEAGIDVSSDDSVWQMAAVAGHFQIASALEEAGFDKEPFAALLQACHVGRIDSVKKLAEMVESIDESERVEDYHQLQATPLTAAALSGQTEIVAMLLESGASPVQPDARGITPWVAAASGAHTEVCELLESKGAAIDVQQAFVVAADRCRPDVVSSLLDQVDVNAKRNLDDCSVSALEAVATGRYFSLDSEDEQVDMDERQEPLFEILLQNGASPDTIGEDGEPLLHRMVNNSCLSGVRLLASHGVDLEAVDADGETALVRAASQNNDDLAARLLYRGASPDACSKDGVPAVLLMFGEYMQCSAVMAKWFIGHGVNLDANDDSQMTLEMHCAQLAETPDDDDDEERDEYSLESATEVLAILRDEDRLQRMHGVLRQTAETREELKKILAVCNEEFADSSLTFSQIKAYISKNSDEAISTLRELLQDEDWRTREGAALSLQDAELSLDEALPLVMAQLTEVDEDVCRAMGGVIEQYGLDMVKALIASVRDCPTASLRPLKNVCLGIQPECSTDLEEAFSSMLTADPESLLGTDRLRAGIVIGIQGDFEKWQENTEKAIELYEKSIRFNPNLQIGFWAELAELKSSVGDPSLQESLSIYNRVYDPDESDSPKELLEQLIEMAPDFPWGLNNLAWEFATSSDENNRDGTRAIELASQVCEQDGWHYHSFLDTIAAAHAENGDFENAVKFVKKAIDAAPQIDVNEYEENLRRYKNREAWPKEDDNE